ncbi:MAG TPA: tetratricopeptide repeat protein [Chthonomonadales bacterium]|nr:tetratricopeptide repeat protein [Chthonomonadales bacterium]
MEAKESPASDKHTERTLSAQPPSGDTSTATGQEEPETATEKDVDERTVEMPSSVVAGGGMGTGPAMTREEQDRRLATELAKRGVSPDEIVRLLSLGRGEPSSSVAGPSPSHTPVAKEASLSIGEPYVPKPTITLPPFRESSPEEKEKADWLLRRANLARRRGQYREAEQACREAIELTPADAVALELYGDILQSCGRVDDALYAYDQAKKADPGRATAEKKYAELRLMQDREAELLRREYIPRNPKVAVLFTALFPGGGQLYNGEAAKGFLIAVTMLILVLILGWTPLGFPGAEEKGITPWLVLFTLLALAVYIYAVVDANIGAGRNNRSRSGWEV